MGKSLLAFLLIASLALLVICQDAPTHENPPNQPAEDSNQESPQIQQRSYFGGGFGYGYGYGRPYYRPYYRPNYYRPWGWGGYGYGYGRPYYGGYGYGGFYG